MITKMVFQFGRCGRDVQPLELDVSAITIFVGPNNSGKSLVLREIESYPNSKLASRSIINMLEFNLPTDHQIENLISEMAKVNADAAVDISSENKLKSGRFNSTKGYMQANQPRSR